MKKRPGMVLQLPPLLREALAVNQAFQRLGFTSEDVFVVLTEGVLYVVLILGEDKTDPPENRKFGVIIGECASSDEEFYRLWADAIELYNGAGDEVRNVLWEKSQCRRQVVPMIATMQSKGIPIPNVEMALARMRN